MEQTQRFRKLKLVVKNCKFQGLHRLGKHDVAVYDGSWTEWGAHSDTPVDTAA